AAIHIRESGSVRIRGGWVWNCLMPYAFGGVAIGLADVSRTAHVFGTQTNVNAAPGFQFVPFDLSATSEQNNHIIYCFSAVAGIDIMVMGGLFAGGEFESAKSASPINTAVTTFRAAVGYKF